MYALLRMTDCWDSMCIGLRHSLERCSDSLDPLSSPIPFRFHKSWRWGFAVAKFGFMKWTIRYRFATSLFFHPETPACMENKPTLSWTLQGETGITNRNKSLFVYRFWCMHVRLLCCFSLLVSDPACSSSMLLLRWFSANALLQFFALTLSVHAEDVFLLCYCGLFVLLLVLVVCLLRYCSDVLMCWCADTATVQLFDCCAHALLIHLS